MLSLEVVDQDSREKIDTWFAKLGFPFLSGLRDDRRNELSGVAPFALLLLESLLLSLRSDRALGLNILLALCSPVFSVVVFIAYLLLSNGKPRWLGVLILVAIPALPAIVFQQNLLLFVLAAFFNWSVYLVARLLFAGVQFLPLLRWASGETLSQTPHLVGVVTRALPVLFIGMVILFFTAEIWQAVHRLNDLSFFVPPSAMLLVAVATQAVHLDRIVREYWEKAQESGWSNAETAMQAVSARFPELETILPMAVPQGERRNPPLQPLVKANVILLLFYAQNLQVIVICAALTLFLLIFGAFSLTLETQAGFVGATDVSQLSLIYSGTLLGFDVDLTVSLAKVALFLAAITYLSFVLYASSDDRYVEKFMKHIDVRIQQAVLVRRMFDCVYWRPRIVRYSGKALQVRFCIPAGVDAASAVLVWAKSKDGSSGRAPMTTRGGVLETELVMEAGETCSYHYEVLLADEWLSRRDYAVDSAIKGADDVEQSVLVVSLSDR